MSAQPQIREVVTVMSPERQALECVTVAEDIFKRLAQLAGPCEWNIDHWLQVGAAALYEIRRGIEIAEEEGREG